MNKFVVWLDPRHRGSALCKASTSTGQHNTKTRTSIHALSAIRTHSPSIQAAEAHALDRVATVITRIIIKVIIFQLTTV